MWFIVHTHIHIQHNPRATIINATPTDSVQNDDDTASPVIIVVVVCQNFASNMVLYDGQITHRLSCGTN